MVQREESLMNINTAKNTQFSFMYLSTISPAILDLPKFSLS